MNPRTYRYWPWTIATTFVAVGLFTAVVSTLTTAVRAPDSETISKAVAFTFFGGILAGCALLPWWMRTVVDDDGITQRGARRTYRIRYADIDELDTVPGSLAWYLRVRCGESTYEVMPCYPLTRGLHTEPRVLRRVCADIERRSGLVLGVTLQ